MNLCSDGHEEVCYETRDCPCCEEISAKNTLIDEIEDLKEQIRNING